MFNKKYFIGYFRFYGFWLNKNIYKLSYTSKFIAIYQIKVSLSL